MSRRFSLMAAGCGMRATLMSLCLIASFALAYNPNPVMIVMEMNETAPVQVNGSNSTAKIALTDVSFSVPGIVSSDFVWMTTRSGTGKVVVNLVGLQPGSTVVTFSGTNNFIPVQGFTSVTVLPAVKTTAQTPQIGVGGDPVNTSTGEYFGTEAVDLNLGGPLPLIFGRYVASRLAEDAQLVANLGDNRSHNFASKLTTLTATLKQIVLPNGRVLKFTKVGTKWTLKRPLDMPFQLIESGTNMLLAYPDLKQIWTYDSNGLLTKIEDGKGNALTLGYTSGRLTLVSDGLGRTITPGYTGSLITSVTDHTGIRVVTFAYTGNVLTSATDYGGHTTTYGNSSGLPASVTRPFGNMLFSQTYDANNKVNAQTERGSDTSTFGYAPTTTTFTDPTLATLVHTYDANGRLVSYADEVGRTITMTHDSAGRRNSVLDRTGDLTKITYNALNGLPATITNAEGKVTTYTYKARVLSGFTFYDLIKITFPDLSALSYGFDAKGNVLTMVDQLGRVWSRQFNTRGQVTKLTNPLLGVSNYTYNAAGNLATSQEPDEGTMSYSYDPRFRLTQIIRPDTTTVTIGYDSKDRITSITDERGKVVTYAYDTNDRLTTVTDPDSNNTAYAYDVLDRVLSVTDRLGKTSSRTFNSRHLVDSETDRNGNAITHQFDARQRPISITDAGSQVWTRQFDDEGLLIGAADPLNPAVKMKRNHLGQIIEISDPLGNTSTLVRDTMQRVTRVLDPLGRQTSYTYDKRGRLLTAAEQGTGTAVYTRDALGHLTKVTDPNGNAWTATYLKSGRIATATDPLLKKWSYVYDTTARGRLTNVNCPNLTMLNFAYDAADNVTQVQSTDVAGPTVNYTYDNQNRLASTEGIIFSYDAEGRITNAQQNAQNFTATYDDGGRLTTVAYLSGAVTVTYQYDTRNRLTQVSDNLALAQIVFGYDAAGRLTSITRTPGIDGTYTYDAASRLTRIQEGSVLDLQYALTPASDVASVDYTAPVTPGVTAVTQTLTFGKAGQITTAGHTYDALGRMTASPGHVYAWDGLSRLITADGVALAYNGLGDVTTRTEGANTTRFYNHYAIGRAPIVYEDTPTGGDRAYVWTPDGRLLYSIDLATSKPSFYHFDRTGSTLAITNDIDAVTDAYAYGPYGEPMPGTIGTSTQPFRYIGKHGVRSEGALYHMRARYYDPRTARFLSRDPMPPRLSDVKSLNLYEYAAQNPLRHVDPEGTREQAEAPAPVQAITQETLNQTRSGMELADLMRATPGGFQLFASASQSNINLRGLERQGVIVANLSGIRNLSEADLRGVNDSNSYRSASEPDLEAILKPASSTHSAAATYLRLAGLGACRPGALGIGAPSGLIPTGAANPLSGLLGGLFGNGASTPGNPMGPLLGGLFSGAAPLPAGDPLGPLLGGLFSGSTPPSSGNPLGGVLGGLFGNGSASESLRPHQIEAIKQFKFRFE